MRFRGREIKKRVVAKRAQKSKLESRRKKEVQKHLQNHIQAYSAQRSSEKARWFFCNRDDSLLGPALGSADDPCSNARERGGMWARGCLDEHSHDDIVNTEMPFLNRLAQVCGASGLRKCENRDCYALKDKTMRDRAPQCEWDPFREWAITVMACQASFSPAQRRTRVHTHIVSAVNVIHSVLRYYRDPDFAEGQRIRVMENKLVERVGMDNRYEEINLLDVCEVIYWMLTIQAAIGAGDPKAGNWGPTFLPSGIINEAYDEALKEANEMGICENRLWSWINVAERQKADLHGLMESIWHRRSIRHKSVQHDGKREDHRGCKPDECKLANIETEGLAQTHKVSRNYEGDQSNLDKEHCGKKRFSILTLEKAFKASTGRGGVGARRRGAKVKAPQTKARVGKGLGTVWDENGKRIIDSRRAYVAVSHVWIDGTGRPKKKNHKGDMNSCLSKYFMKRVQELKCEGIWWDAISIPATKSLRSRALKRMQQDYKDATYTVIHDNYLTGFRWDSSDNDGSACVAIVLSPWFSRAWTALELHMSTIVRVIYKDSDGKAVMVDLDDEILAKDPARSTRAHWIASEMIRRLRKPVISVNDVLAIVKHRATKVPRDRLKIAAMLAGIPGNRVDVLAEFKGRKGDRLLSKAIFKKLNRVGYASLLHSERPMRKTGPWSWSPMNLLDMPFESARDFDSAGETWSNELYVSSNGSVTGKWHYRALTRADASDISGLRPAVKGDDKEAGIEAALEEWYNCLLLRKNKRDRWKALLVKTVSVSRFMSLEIIDCRYVGAVREDKHKPLDREGYVRLGKDEGKAVRRASDVLSKLQIIPSQPR
ncbi:MAG: hypothetical protein M1840_001161 [Geoglossum simile]|nr:MAG: hypothetical protein M1840_001161 [Geoglossum simile]